MQPSDMHSTYRAVIADLQQSDIARARRLDVGPQPCHLRELDAIAAALPAGGTFLDIGTGLGIVPETMLRMGARVICVDAPRNDDWRWAVNRLVDLGAEGHFAFVGQEQIAIPDGTVDVALAADVIEHLPATPRFFLAELKRVLKPGGHLVLTTPNAVRLTARLRIALGYSNWPPVALYYDDPPAPPFHASHHHEYTAAEMGDVLNRAGFMDARVSFFEDTLCRTGIIRSLRDIPAQDRFAGYWSGRSQAHPLELARLGLLAMTTLVPGLRSTLIAAARKP